MLSQASCNVALGPQDSLEFPEGEAALGLGPEGLFIQESTGCMVGEGSWLSDCPVVSLPSELQWLSGCPVVIASPIVEAFSDSKPLSDCPVRGVCPIVRFKLFAR